MKHALDIFYLALHTAQQYCESGFYENQINLSQFTVQDNGRKTKMNEIDIQNNLFKLLYFIHYTFH